MNPNYPDGETPENYRDWLHLIYESIHNSENPNINNNNAGVKRAAELVNQDNISPEERAASKIEAGKKKVLARMYDEGREDQLIEMVINLWRNGVAIDIIAKSANLTEAQVLQIIESQGNNNS